MSEITTKSVALQILLCYYNLINAFDRSDLYSHVIHRRRQTATFMVADMEDQVEEAVEEAESLDNRVVAARQSKDEMEQLIKDYMPFLNSRVARYSSRTEYDKREELQSVAMMSFYEAVQKYDADKGHFFPFVNQVVRARIIDSIRKVYKFDEHTIPLETEDDEQNSSKTSTIDNASMRFYDIQRRQEQITDEIEQFKQELSTWGITMETLSQQSPKHRKVLDTYKAAIAKIAQNVDVIQTIQLKCYFPVKAIANITGLPLKNVERARTFILASLIIKLGDYDYLSEYVRDGRDGAV